MASGLLVNAKMSLGSFVHETSIVAKLGCVLLSLFYALSFVFNPLSPLGITPGNLIPPNFWIWTIFTHQLIEVNIVFLIISFIVLIQSSTILEPLWGIAGLGTFFAVVTVISGLLSGAFYLICYMVTFNITYLFDVSIYGFAGYTAGFLVALKQSRGDQMLIGSIGLHVKHLPLVNLALTLLLRIAGLITVGYFILSLNGMLVAWIYLRFYQSHSRGRGDAAESFAFKTFFPKPLEAPVGTVGDAMFNLLLKLKICRKTSYRYDVGAPSKITISLSGVDALDAERRRNKALKALDERLQKSQTVPEESTDWPELDDDQSKTSHAPKALDDAVSSSSVSSHSDIVRIDLETSSPSDENPSH